MRKIIIAGNWKMNKTPMEAIELVNLLKRDLTDVTEVDIDLAAGELVAGLAVEPGAPQIHRDAVLPGVVLPTLCRDREPRPETDHHDDANKPTAQACWVCSAEQEHPITDCIHLSPPRLSRRIKISFGLQ